MMDVMNTCAGQINILTHQAAQVTKLVLEVGFDRAIVPPNHAVAT